MNAGHVAVFVNARQLQETYADELTNADEQLDELVDLMASQVPTANGGPNLQSVWDAYRDMGRVAIQALKDKDQSIRQQAINDLGEIGPKAKAAVPGLVRTFSDGHPGDRFLVARTLGQIGRDAKEAIPVITIALQDDDENLQRVAAEALKKITK